MQATVFIKLELKTKIFQQLILYFPANPLYVFIGFVF